MTNRIDKRFNELRPEKAPAFMPFIVGGDPNFQTSLKIAKAVCKQADLLEVGFPYSDPLADGPTIQAADSRALRGGATTDSIFKLIKNIRKTFDVPITVLVYANLVVQKGIDEFYCEAKKAGIDGVLVPDVPVEEIAQFSKAAAKYGIRQIFLVTQTTTDARLKQILRHAKGFLYLVSVLGVTGARKNFTQETPGFIKRVRKQTKLPLCVGFGVSTPQQFKAMIKSGADGCIVGSALIDVISRNFGRKRMLKEVEKFTSEFKS